MKILRPKQFLPHAMPAPRRRGLRRGRGILSLVLLLLVSAFSSQAMAQLPENDPFATLLTRRAPSAVELSTGEPQLFETTEGAKKFAFQAKGNAALIRYLCDGERQASLECALLDGVGGEEIFLLTAKRSPRGDVTYKDVTGATVLRVTANGGATLYLPQADGAQEVRNVFATGHAVLPVVGVRPDMTPPPADRPLVEQRMRRATELLYQRHGLFVPFVAPGPSQQDNVALADTVLTTAKAIDMIASDPLGLAVLQKRLDMVEIRRAELADVRLEGRTLLILYAPEQSVRGRPSSMLIARFLEAHL